MLLKHGIVLKLDHFTNLIVVRPSSCIVLFVAPNSLKNNSK